ncbi:retrovirus-related pol polyprotein from transposon TNT 1-94 [Tanacetum coccineum]
MHNNIMAAGLRDRPPMLATGRYAQWQSRFIRYVDTKQNGDALRKCILQGPYKLSNITIPGQPTTTETPKVLEQIVVETFSNISPENKAHFDAEKEAIHLILTESGDEIYLTVDACKTAHDMWIAIERLQQGESLFKRDVKTSLFWKFGRFTSRDGESIESYYSMFYKMMNEMQTVDLDKESYHKLFHILKQYQKEVNEIRAEKIAKNANLLALEFGHFAKKYRKPKRAKDYTYHKEKMLLCKQAEKGVPLQADWLEDTDEEIDEQELESLEKVDSNVISDSSDMCDNDDHTDQNAEKRKDERVLKSKDNKSKNSVLKNTKSSSTYVWKTSSSASLDSNKCETKDSNVCQTNACISNFKTVNACVTAVNDGSNIVCISCGKDVFFHSHEKCVARHALSRKSSVKRALFTSPVAAKSKNLGATLVVAKSRLSVAKTPTTTNKVSSAKKISPDSCQSRILSTYMNNKIATRRKWQKWFEYQQGFNWSPKSKTAQSQSSVKKSKTSVIQLVLWIVDSGCSKHMTGNLQLLRNCVEKFMGTFCYGNDHFAAITGYGDYVQGNLTICHVYYVEGLGHNLFLVIQFCDRDLEVAFRSNTCYVRNLKGDDLLTGSQDLNLYTISNSEMAASSPVCLMSRATSTKSWLWHRRLSHLNFGTINQLTSHDLVDGLPKFNYNKDHLCSACEQGKSKKATLPPKLVPSTESKLELLHMDLCGPMRVASINGKKYILVIVDDYSRYTWVYFLRTKDEAQNMIIDFVNQVQRNLKAQILTIRTNNGTEFKNEKLRAFYAKLGIVHKTSIARMPQQNGVVEH